MIERLRVLIWSRYPVSSGSSVSFLLILRLVEVGIPEVISFGLRVADESYRAGISVEVAKNF